MFSMVYDGAQRFFIAPQIAPQAVIAPQIAPQAVIAPTTKKDGKKGLMVL